MPWPDLITAAAVLTVLIWLYLLLARGGFWRAGRLELPPGHAAASPPIAVVVPARDEAGVVAASITSLLQQDWDGPLHVFLVDDGSSDQTAEIAREAARRAGRLAQLTVIEGKPLPAGWLGKVWAMQQGIERALSPQHAKTAGAGDFGRELAPEFLVLTDADIVHAPDGVSRLVAKAQADGYDLASLMVKLYCRSLAEKLLIPAFVFFFLMLYPPQWIADRRRAVAGAAGGCMLIRPAALERAGGMAAIRHEVIDDCALARTVKRSGGRVYLGLSASTVSIRPFGSLGEIGHMIARSAFNQLNHSLLMLLAAFLGLMITYVAPPLLLVGEALRGRLLPAGLGGLGWLLMGIAYRPMVKFYRLNAPWAFLLPVVATFYMGATLYSALKYWLGQGGEWKGRTQDQAASSRRA